MQRKFVKKTVLIALAVALSAMLATKGYAQGPTKLQKPISAKQAKNRPIDYIRVSKPVFKKVSEYSAAKVNSTSKKDNILQPVSSVKVATVTDKQPSVNENWNFDNPGEVLGIIGTRLYYGSEEQKKQVLNLGDGFFKALFAALDKKIFSNPNEDLADKIIFANTVYYLQEKINLSPDCRKQLVGWIISNANQAKSLLNPNEVINSCYDEYRSCLVQLSFLTKKDLELKFSVMKGLNFTQRQADIYMKYGVILYEGNNKLSDDQFKWLDNVLSTFGPRYNSYIGVITSVKYKDYKNLAGYASKSGYIWVSRDWMTGNVLTHEIAHLIDFRDKNDYTDRLRDVFKKLNDRSGNNLKNYEREYGMTNIFEDFATSIAGWVENSKNILKDAIGKAKVGRKVFLQKILVAADVFSYKKDNGKEYTTKYRITDSGKIKTKDVSIKRGENGVITKIGKVKIKDYLIMDDAWLRSLGNDVVSRPVPISKK